MILERKIHNTSDLIYLINSSIFQRRPNFPYSFLNSRSNGPQEVWASLTNQKIKNRTVIVDKNESTWPEKNSKVVVVKDFLSVLPNPLIERLKDCKLRLGPNIDFSLDSNRVIYNNFTDKKVLVPSSWITPYLAHKTGISARDVQVWVSGIDEEEWEKKSNSKKVSHKVLLYMKGNNDKDLVQQYSSILRKKGFQIEPIVYGGYKQSEYRKKLAQSKFMIWFGTTESQSIAQFQSWAMDVPTLVQKQELFIENSFRFKASSSPYLSEFTGDFFEHNSNPEEVIDAWLNKIEIFEPRDWLRQNHTIELAFENLKVLFNT